MSWTGWSAAAVAFGFADESSPQLSANTARLWALGKADRVVNTDKQRANTFGFFALQGRDYCQALRGSSAESFIALFPQIRALHDDYEAVILLWDNSSCEIWVLPASWVILEYLTF